MLRRSAPSLAAVISYLSACCVPGCSPPGAEPRREPHVQPEGTPIGPCSAVLRSYGSGSGTHLPECSHIDYGVSPPVFGDHYAAWPAYQSYEFPVPLGYLVHALEHGAVVFYYDCPSGCADEVANVQTFIDALPDDPRCSAAVRVQVVLVPRPGLGARWAASAWGHSLTADCFDADAFSRFYADHHGRGPEDLCTQGVALAVNPCP